MRSNLNLNFGEFYREHRYINCAKSAQRVLNSGAGTTYWLNVNNDFYPTTLAMPVSFTVYLPEAGTYVVRWLGLGSFTATSFAARTNAPSGVYTGGGASGTAVTNGRMTFVTAADDSSSSVTITSDGTMSAFVICQIELEDDLDAGEIFRPAFITKLQDFNPHAIRFMDSQETNRSLLRDWSERPTTTQITYHNQHLIRNNIVGDSGGGVGMVTWTDGGATDVYVGGAYSGMPGTYQHGEVVHGNIATNNTKVAATLNVGGRGAKAMVNENGYLDPAGNSDEHPVTGGPRSFIYDAKTDKFYFNNAGVKMGSPIEMLIALCNKAGLDGWFCIPSYATDDFVTQFTNLLVATYIPSTVYVEYANEIWNTADGFPMTNRMAAWGEYTFPGIGGSSGGNYSGWYGYRMAQIAAIMRPIFAAAGQASKLKIVLASQGSLGDNVLDLTNLIENKRFQNVAFPALSGANAPILSADYISYGLYYAGKSVRWKDNNWTSIAANVPALVVQVDNYLSGNPVLMRAALEWLRDDMTVNFLSYAGVTGPTGRYSNWNTLAVEYSKPVIQYEQNHEIDGPSTAWATGAPINDASYGGQSGKINQFLLAFLNSAQYEQVVSCYLNSFGSLSNSVSASLFGMCTGNPWLTHQKHAPMTETTLAGSTLEPGYGNWRIHELANNEKRRFVMKT